MDSVRKKEFNAQAERHKREAIGLLLTVNGSANGYTRQTLRHVDTWYFTQMLDAVPKVWQAKVADIFDQLIPAAQMQQLDRAVSLYLEGDDAELRPYVKGRLLVEIGFRSSNLSWGGAPIWRSRKFSDPLYLTPAGFLHGYPEVDEDLFLDRVQAMDALDFYFQNSQSDKLKNASYRIVSSAVLGKIGGPGYKRWLQEVKGQNYTEPRRSLAESHELYQASGREGLEKLYSRAYVFALIRKFNAEGFEVRKEDFDRIVHPWGFLAIS